MEAPRLPVMLHIMRTHERNPPQVVRDETDRVRLDKSGSDPTSATRLICADQAARRVPGGLFAFRMQGVCNASASPDTRSFDTGNRQVHHRTPDKVLNLRSLAVPRRFPHETAYSRLFRPSQTFSALTVRNDPRYSWLDAPPNRRPVTPRSLIPRSPVAIR